jgi:hypothetical protein
MNRRPDPSGGVTIATGATSPEATFRSAMGGGVAPSAGTAAGTGAGGGRSEPQSAGDGEDWSGVAAGPAFDDPAGDEEVDVAAADADGAGATMGVAGARLGPGTLARGGVDGTDGDADEPHAATSVAAIMDARMRAPAVEWGLGKREGRAMAEPPS